MWNALIDGLIGATVGSIATVAAAMWAKQAGMLQLEVIRNSHELDIARAVPKIGTEVRIEESYPNGPQYSPTYTLTTSIYNAGEHSASQVEGEWKLTCPNNSVQQGTMPIRREFLSATPYQLEPFALIGTTILNAMRGDAGHGVTFNVDIEFNYRGLPKQQPQHYREKYAFDEKNRRMKRQF